MHTTVIFYAITFLSGAAALAYEMLWARGFANIFGSTIEAMSLTFAGLLLGMGIGGFVFGYIADRFKKLRLLYFVIELGIAISACGLGMIMHYHDIALARLFDNFETPVPLTLIMMLVPTMLIGATFPVLFKLAQIYDLNKDCLGRIYAVNIAGAAFGVVLTGFWFIAQYGVLESFWIAGIANIMSGLAVFALPQITTESKKTHGPDDLTSSLNSYEVRNDALPFLKYLILLLTGFLSGFLVFGQEIIWTRFSSYLLGNRIFAIATLLFSVLILLALGSFIASRIARYRSQHAIQDIALAALISAIGSSLAIYIGHSWIENMDYVDEFLPGGEAFYSLYRFALTFLLLVPVMVPLGILFPLTLIYAAGTVEDRGRKTGQLYLANMLGAVIGSLLTGLKLVATIGTMKTGYLLVFMTFALGLILYVSAILHRFNEHLRPNYIIPAALAFISIFFIPLDPPILIQSRFPHDTDRSHIVVAEESKYGLFQIFKKPVQNAYNGNHLIWAKLNKFRISYFAGLRPTQFTHEIAAHLAKFYNPGARDVAVLGSGYGITAGAIAQYDDVEKVDAIEILPSMIKYTHYFSNYNYEYYNDEKVDIHLHDARYFLATTPQDYDAVILTPPNQHIPKASRLAHKEFFDIVSDKLRSGGVFIAHLFGGEMDNVLHTMTTSFEHFRFYSCYHGETLCVVASNQPLEWRKHKIKQLTQQPRIQQMFEKLGYDRIEETNVSIKPRDVFQHHYNTEAILEKVKGKQLVTDNHPLTEFYYGEVGELLYISK